MEHVNKINLDRLLWCCNEAELSLSDLFTSLKISEVKADKLLKNESNVLTFNELGKISKHFDRGLLFFYEDGAVNEEKLLSPQYRTIQNQKPNVSFTVKKLIRHLEQHREIYLSLVEDLDWDIPVVVEYPEIPKKASFKTKAEILRKWLGVGKKNTFESYRRAIESKGIMVVLTNGHNGKWQLPKENTIRGFALFHQELPVIVVKKISDNQEAQSFTLMHELAHLVLHQESFIDDEDDFQAVSGREKEANVVAGFLLVPDQFIEPFEKDELALLQVSVFRNYFRNRESVHILGKPYVGAVLTALQENTISLTKASKFLNGIKLTDIHRLQESYARM